MIQDIEEGMEILRKQWRSSMSAMRVFRRHARLSEDHSEKKSALELANAYRKDMREIGKELEQLRAKRAAMLPVVETTHIF